MSGKPDAKGAPIDFSQSDIDQLTVGRRPASVTRRLKATRTSGARRRAGGDKRAPASVKRADLAALRAGHPSPALRKRLFPKAVGNDALPSDRAATDERKEYPTQSPPRRRGKA